MLAPSTIPETYRQWNTQHAAPEGKPVPRYRLKKLLLSEEQFQQRRGPFSIQTNCSTRAFEYPWVFEAGKFQPGMKVLEIGGGLSGFQFILDQYGCSVVNVDPGMEAKGRGWPCDDKSMAALNRCFRTRVDLRNTTLDQANLTEDEFDRAYSISVIEHLPSPDALNVMAHTYRCLKPGGLFILTIDLFLNLSPFSSRTKNEFGSNQNLCELIASQPWELTVGQRNELFGFPEFNADKVLSQLEKFLIGQTYPVLVQCLVLMKPVGS